jgi:hypothetical protein
MEGMVLSVISKQQLEIIERFKQLPLVIEVQLNIKSLV